MNAKRKAISDRIEHLEDSILYGREYLASGKHAHWHGFRALFNAKVRNGRVLPPHKDWVANVFLPRREKALEDAYRLLEKLK